MYLYIQDKKGRKIYVDKQKETNRKKNKIKIK